LARVAIAIGLFVAAAPVAAATAPAAAAAAEANYRFYCAQCHGLAGAGDGPNATRHQPVEPRNFTSGSEMSILTDAEIIRAIEHGGASVGKSTLMPPFVSTLTGKEIVELKDYLRRLCRCAGPESR
jgi:cytochrome c oxidase cbb3-type subunit 3